MTKRKPVKATKAQLIRSQRGIIRAVSLLADQVRDLRIAQEALTKRLEPKPIAHWDYTKQQPDQPMTSETVDMYTRELKRGEIWP